MGLPLRHHVIERIGANAGPGRDSFSKINVLPAYQNRFGQVIAKTLLFRKMTSDEIKRQYFAITWPLIRASGQATHHAKAKKLIRETLPKA